MATQTITIRVNPEAARVYNTATDEQRRKLEALLSLQLTEVARTTRPLEEIMSEMGRKAQARGLTPEILESLLNERERPSRLRYEYLDQCRIVGVLKARTSFAPRPETWSWVLSLSTLEELADVLQREKFERYVMLSSAKNFL